MKNLLTLLFAISTYTAFAQPTHRPDGAPAIGVVTGKIIDATTKQAIEYASVAVVRLRDSTVVTGGLTDADGNFLIEQVPFGKYALRVDFVGYRRFNSPATFTIKPPDNIKIAAGTLAITTTAASLETVTVTAERAAFVNNIDKKVFNVGKDIMAAGGSASDILQNVPSVTVDIDGNVALRGSANVTILIDGKPSALMGGSKADILRQLPAGSIESVELITNPSAKYDPEGVSGIINIVLKKNNQRGFNGTVTVGAGTGDKYNGNLAINYRTPTYNVFGTYGYRNDTRVFNGYFERKSLLTNGIYDILNTSNGKKKDIGHNARVGADFYLNKNHTLGIGGGINVGNGNKTELTHYNEKDSAYTLRNYFERNNGTTETNLGYDGNLNYKWQMPKPKQELTADVSYSRNKNVSLGVFTPDTSRLAYNELITHQIGGEQQNLTNQNQVFTAQTDYTQPLGNGKLEAGYRYTNRAVETDLAFYRNTNTVSTLDGRSNDFSYAERIHAAYGTYTGIAFDKLGYQAGLRLEQTNTAGDLKTTNVQTAQNYFSAFPSANINYKPNATEELRLSFSRRIRRPNGEEVNPFPDYDSPTVLRSGNPNIRPEFTNAYELGFVKNWEKHSLSATTYFRRTEDQIQRFITINPDNGVTTVSFINFAKRDNYGVELISKNEVTKWWNLLSTVNGFRTEVSTGSAGGNVSNAGLGFSARVQSNMTLPAALTLQLTGNYNTPFVMAQGSFAGMSSMDLGLRKDFAKGLFNLALSVNDVFDTQRFEVNTAGYNFEQHAIRKRESRVLRLTFTTRFGNIKSDSKSRRKSDNGDNSGGGVPDGGGI